MKIEIEKIKTTMIENGIDDATVEAVITQLEAEAALAETQDESVPDENEAPTDDDLTDNSEDLPKIKYEHVIILNDKEGYLKDKEIAGWVVQQEENADAGMILGKMKDAAKDQNETAKKKTAQITSMEDMFDGLKPKWLKNKNIRIKTKDLTRVIISNGKF
jgi:hypothetical protein